MDFALCLTCWTQGTELLSCSAQGGSSWNRAASFHNINYGVESMQDSADRVYDCISRAPSSDAVVVMAHNGPAGVGSETYSICGKDWSTKGGETCLMLHALMESTVVATITIALANCG